MFDTVCTYPLTSDLLTQSIHPKAPLLALGLASGHVQVHRLPPSDPTEAPEAGHGTIETAWRTRRHKGSCRSLCFSHDGEHLISAGTDGIVKLAFTETGQVVSKIIVPLQKTTVDPTCLLHTLSPQTLLLATDSSALHLYDLRSDSTFAASTPQQTFHPHDDYISSLVPLPPGNASTSGFSKQWVSTGGTTVAVTDLRRGVLTASEDQGEELLSSEIVGGKLAVGGEKGALRFWNVGLWDDNEGKILVEKGASADTLAAVPDGVGKEQMLAVGMDDGVIRLVGMGAKKPRVIGEVSHDEVESVGGLGFEVGGRMISGGGQVVKVWAQTLSISPKDEGEKDEDEEDEDGVEGASAANAKRPNGFGSDEDHSEAYDGGSSSDEEERPKRKRKKKKRNKGRSRSGGQHVLALKGID